MTKDEFQCRCQPAQPAFANTEKNRLYDFIVSGVRENSVANFKQQLKTNFYVILRIYQLSASGFSCRIYGAA